MERIMPETKVQWGILGTANIAKKVGGAIKTAENAELIAVASRSHKRANQWAKNNQIDRAYGSYDELLEDPQINAVYIPLPPSMHAEWTIKAADQGKHILCEKPLSVTVNEAVAMSHACKANQVQLMDGVMWVHHDRTSKMLELIKNGSLGEMRRVTATFTFNWDQIPHDNIRVKKELGGGSLGDLGYYCIRAILWAFSDYPTRVFATARHENGVDYNLTAILWFDGQRMASFDCGFDTGVRKWFEIAGTQASLICDDFTVPWKPETARFWIHHANGKDAEHQIDDCVQEVKMIEYFSTATQNGVFNSKLIADAINTMHICDALKKSIKFNQVIDLTFKKGIPVK